MQMEVIIFRLSYVLEGQKQKQKKSLYLQYSLTLAKNHLSPWQLFHPSLPRVDSIHIVSVSLVFVTIMKWLSVGSLYRK